MTTLGFDTATLATAVALRIDGAGTREARDDPSAGGHPGHATRLLALADELLRHAGAGWDTVERIAVGVGPGRFTGLRVGIATARALSQSVGADLVGVPTLRALARSAEADAPDGHGLLAVIDGRRGEVFLAAYAFDGDEPRELDFGRPRRANELQDALAEAAAWARDSRLWYAVGDGALAYREELERAGALVAPEESSAHLVRAAAICDLASQLTPVIADELIPDYRRTPDAALAGGGRQAGAEAR
jgi:tRNA threonylcarbamoyladenosine biosynthesis protein TsaB